MLTLSRKDIWHALRLFCSSTQSESCFYFINNTSIRRWDHVASLQRNKPQYVTRKLPLKLCDSFQTNGCFLLFVDWKRACDFLTFIHFWHYSSYMHFCVGVCVCMCLCVRLHGHGRQPELHCSSSLAVINRYVSFPMVPLAWRRESSPWRARRVSTSAPAQARLTATRKTVCSEL